MSAEILKIASALTGARVFTMGKQKLSGTVLCKTRIIPCYNFEQAFIVSQKSSVRLKRFILDQPKRQRNQCSFDKMKILESLSIGGLT